MRRIPLLPLVLATATLIVLVGFVDIVQRNVQQMRTLRNHSQLVEHSLGVQRELDGVLLQATEADSAARGFLITGNESAAREYAQAKTNLDRDLTQLDAVVSDNPRQHARAGKLRAAIAGRLGAVDRVLDIRRTHGLDEAMRESAAIDTNRWRAEVRAIAAEMERDEAGLLATRKAEADQAYARAVNGRVGSGIVSAVLLVGILVFYLVHERSRQQREAALVESERRAHEAAAREQDARAEAEQANRLKDDFLAVLSHELRTPLNAVLGWAQIVQTANPGDPTIVRALGSIKRNAEAQQRLVEDLLDVSRIVTGKFPVERRPFELRTAIAAAIETVRPAAAARDIELAVRLDSCATIDGDPDRLEQVAQNLLSNAVKFTAPGGHIEVTLSSDRGRATLVVRDDGEGIPPELQPHIFDRFRQGDASSTRAHGGLGLGLAIVKHIVEAHGGSIAATSEGKDKGSTFRVELPVQ